MENLVDTNKRMPAIVLLVGVWLVYVIACEITKFYDSLALIHDGLVASGAILTSVLMLGFAVWLWYHAAKITKITFGLFAIAFACLLIVDLVFQTTYNILHIPESKTSTILMDLYSVAYVGYLFCQLAAWGSILSTLKSYERRIVLAFIPAVVIIFAIALLYLFASYWHPERYTLSGFYTGFDVIFELISFVPALLCLITCKNRGVTYLAIGYVIIMAVGFIINLNLLPEFLDSDSIVHGAWMLYGVWTICGLALMKKQAIYLPENLNVELPLSLRSQITFWAMISGILGFMILTVMVYFI